MVQGIAFPDMTDGAVHECGCRMGARAAAVIGVDGEYGLNVTAFAFYFRTIIQIQTGMVAAPHMTGCTGLCTIDMEGLGIRMAYAACHPIQGHIGYIR